MSRNKFYVVLLVVCFGIWGCSNGNEPVENTLDEWYIGAVPGSTGTIIVDFKSKPGEVGVFVYESDDTGPGKMYRLVEYMGYTVKGNSITLESVTLPTNMDIRYTSDFSNPIRSVEMRWSGSGWGVGRQGRKLRGGLPRLLRPARCGPDRAPCGVFAMPHHGLFHHMRVA